MKTVGRMKFARFLVVASVAVPMVSASGVLAAAAGETGPCASRLLFRSGFEGDIRLVPSTDGDMAYIVGVDRETGFSWPLEILGSSGSGLHYIQDDGRRAVGSDIRTVIGHDGRPTRALYSYENYAHDATQNPYEILDISEGRKDLYVRFWIRLDGESLSQKDTWRTFFEWKTRGYAKGRGFRLISFVYTDEEGRPYWHWQGDRDPEHPIWEIDNFDVPVPRDEWFVTEFFWHWSQGADGRALWKVNGQVIGDHFGPTTRYSQPIDFIMLAQIYGDGNPKHQWIDDIEIRDGWPVPDLAAEGGSRCPADR